MASLPPPAPDSPSPPPPPPPAPPKKVSRLRAAISEYGVPFLVYWTGVWAASGVSLYALMEVTEVDSLQLLRDHLGLELKVDKALGNLGVAIAVNEALEVVRLPLCLITFKGAMKRWKNLRGTKD